MTALDLDVRELSLDEINSVNGGIIDAIIVWINSHTANRTCGKGNVAEVTTEGFTCKK